MAEPQPDSNEGQNNKPLEPEDRDFDPTAEALIDDIDDERTLEEEEALDDKSGAAVQEELDDLKRESEMSIEELLAYYERMRNESGEQVSEEEPDHEQDSDHRIEDKSNAQDRTEVDSSVKPTSGNSEKMDKLQPEQSSDSNNPTNPSTQEQEKMSGGVSSSADTLTVENSESEITSNQLDHSEKEISPEESNTSITNQEKPKHPMTDFMIDDEGGVFKTLLGYDLDDSDDMDEDYSYTDDEYADDDRDWRRSIHVGPEHQADVPDGLSEYDGLPPYENKDILVWKCGPNISAERLIQYLKEASALSRNDISISPASVPKISYDGYRIYRERMNDLSSSSAPQSTGEEPEKPTSFQPDTHPNVYMSQSRKRMRIDYELEQENALDNVNQVYPMSHGQLTSSREDNSSSTSQDTKPDLSTEEYYQDEEQLLYLLLQCNYNFDEAMRRRKLDPFKYYLYEPMSLWSQEECLSFEDGLRTYGKDFRSIRENKVQTRTHAEVVAFYYLWKKSERHDVYTNQYKLDRKRSLSHPGTTDYMDRFIEDNESIANASSSSTPTPLETSGGTNAGSTVFKDNDQSLLTIQGSEPPPPNDSNDIINNSAGSKYTITLHMPPAPRLVEPPSRDDEDLDDIHA